MMTTGKNEEQDRTRALDMRGTKLYLRTRRNLINRFKDKNMLNSLPESGLNCLYQV